MDFKANKIFSRCILALLSILLWHSPLQAAGSTDSRLAGAVKRRDIKAALSLLEQKADVNAPQADGATALQWAAHWDDLETAELLIRAGANASAANAYGVTALSLACTNGSAAMVEKLLNAGARPNVVTLTGETPLMTCAATGSADAMKLLLDHGATVNTAENERGQTALMWAAAGSHTEAVRVLMEHGADLQARSKGGFTALLFAAQQGCVECARLLLAAGANVNEATEETGSALVVAAASGREALAKFLLEQGADPNAADIYGITALHYAVQKGISDISGFEYRPSHQAPPNMPELVKALLERGANPNARIARVFPRYSRSPFPPTITMVGATPLLLAAASADFEMMKALLSSGADVKLATIENTSVLMAASGVGQVQDRTDDEAKRALQAVALAAKLGNDVNQANDAGHTALHGAALTGGDAIIQFLADQGANVNAVTKYRIRPRRLPVTPLDLAQGEGPIPHPHKSTEELLLRLGGHKAAKTAPGQGSDPAPYQAEKQPSAKE